MISLRSITEDDFGNLFVWRNDPETRRHFRSPAPIERGPHLAWCAKIQLDPNCAHLIGEQDGKPVGVLRYDINGLWAKASIYLVPGLGGRGLGTELLRGGTGWIKENHPSVRKLKALVKLENIASTKVFEKSGFMAGVVNKGFVEYIHADF
jgi:RimJ/RimL family protein N-acetyltransferase